MFHHYLVEDSRLTNKFILLKSLIAVSKRYNNFSVLNANEFAEQYDLIAFFGKRSILHLTEEVIFEDKQWKYGFISYDYKNTIEKLNSKGPSLIDTPSFACIIPEWVLTHKNNQTFIHCKDSISFEQFLNQLLESEENSDGKTSFHLAQGKLPNENMYHERFERIQQYIKEGLIYEINYCIEFPFDFASIDPYAYYLKLNEATQAPFSSIFRYDDLFVLSSSPERFLAKTKNKLLTQPMKGTAPRYPTISVDEAIRNSLLNNPKERNENVMIVDVARNDLSRIANRASVSVEGMFNVITYKKVHQMISTVMCELKPEISFKEIIDATFPMASMTGAPKISAMKIIDELESSSRGLYSGALFYIRPDGDFDSSVIIRSILYEQGKNKLSFSVGSAITSMSKVEEEYRECLLKAEAMMDVLEINNSSSLSNSD